MATTIAADHTPLNFDENTVEATSLKKAIDPNSLLLASNTKDNDLANNALAELNKQKKQLLRFYRSTILTSTYKKIVYPSSAIDKNQQGKVVLKVIVDRSGKVQSIDLKEKSKFKLLNKAANRAVTKAHFPSVPSELEGDEFEFLLPIQFSLN
jgi:TonB family protein